MLNYASQPPSPEPYGLFNACLANLGGELTFSERWEPSQFGTSQDMSPERWQHINELYLVARDLDPESRAAYLEAVCGADRHLLAAVMSLITAQDERPAETPIETPEVPVTPTPPVPVEEPVDETIDKPIDEPVDEPEDRPVDEAAEEPAEEPIEDPVYRTVVQLIEDSQPAAYPINGHAPATTTSSKTRKLVGILKGFLRRGLKPSAGARQ